MRGFGDYSGPPQLQPQPWVEQMAVCMLRQSPPPPPSQHTCSNTQRMTEASLWHVLYTTIISIFHVPWFDCTSLCWLICGRRSETLGWTDSLNWPVSLCLWLSAKLIQGRHSVLDTVRVLDEVRGRIRPAQMPPSHPLMGWLWSTLTLECSRLVLCDPSL